MNKNSHLSHHFKLLQTDLAVACTTSAQPFALQMVPRDTGNGAKVEDATAQCVKEAD